MKVNKRPVYRIIKTAEETFKLDSLKVLLENISSAIIIIALKMKIQFV